MTAQEDLKKATKLEDIIPYIEINTELSLCVLSFFELDSLAPVDFEFSFAGSHQCLKGDFDFYTHPMVSWLENLIMLPPFTDFRKEYIRAHCEIVSEFSKGMGIDSFYENMSMIYPPYRLAAFILAINRNPKLAEEVKMFSTKFIRTASSEGVFSGLSDFSDYGGSGGGGRSKQPTDYTFLEVSGWNINTNTSRPWTIKYGGTGIGVSSTAKKNS